MTTRIAKSGIVRERPALYASRYYCGYALIPGEPGTFEVFRPSGAQLTFAGRCLFTARGARALIRLDLKLRGPR